MNLSQQKPI